MFSTFVVKVRANDEDADELVEASESAVDRGVLSVEVEGRWSSDSCCKRLVRFAMGSDSMFRRFWVKVLDIAENAGVTCSGAKDDVDDDDALGASLSVVVSCDDSCIINVAGTTVVTVPLGGGTAASMPGTMAAGTGGGAGSGDIGSLVGNKG